jgi:UDP-sugar transporter A1/2/3
MSSQQGSLIWQTFTNVFSIKYGALALLVLQNTFLVVFMGYSRTRDSGPLYASSTAVAVMEIVKFVSCLAVIAHEKASVTGLFRALKDELFAQPMELLKLSVPSVLYSIQNNLLYYALSHLDAATFQVSLSLSVFLSLSICKTLLQLHRLAIK